MTFEQHPDPIIVFGAPRSGTTYLHKILNSHPDIYVSHETRVFAWLHQSLEVLTRKDAFLFTEREAFQRFLVDQYRDLIRNFYRTLSPQRRYWGDKNPHYADVVNKGCLNTIAALFPGTKFINIIRDGRDVVSSLVRKRHTDGKPWADFETAHQVWTNHVDIGREFGSSLSRNDYHEIRYEALVAQDIEVTEELFEFLAIDMHEDVYAFCESQQTSRTPFSGPTRDIADSAGSSDWLRVFSCDERIRSLTLFGEHLVELGYESATSLAALKETLLAEDRPVKITADSTLQPSR